MVSKKAVDRFLHRGTSRRKIARFAPYCGAVIREDCPERIYTE